MGVIVWSLGGLTAITTYFLLLCVQAGCPLQAWQNAFWLAWLAVLSFIMCSIVQGELR